ncbi:MAG: cupin domain-containing protein [Alphaproteobacteria bacterium]|nr:cupin domain-containing protein [Alphaproteobacteria bacterium]
MTADEIISLLAMQPHPEGGYFCETFRDEVSVSEEGRAASTAIYFLLKAGQSSHWHTVDASEIWHWYAGAPLKLGIAPPQGPARHVTLGNDLIAGHRPQAVVPPGHWQRAESLGDYTLVGCTVAPGFMFETFVLAPPGFEPGNGA